jgi:hypothetical protein
MNHACLTALVAPVSPRLQSHDSQYQAETSSICASVFVHVCTRIAQSQGPLWHSAVVFSNKAKKRCPVCQTSAARVVALNSATVGEEHSVSLCRAARPGARCVVGRGEAPALVRLESRMTGMSDTRVVDPGSIPVCAMKGK